MLVHEDGATYHVSPMSHEDGEIGQVTAGASGVALVGSEQFAALRGPVARHAALGVIPEGAVGIVVVYFLQNTNGARGGGALNINDANVVQYAGLHIHTLLVCNGEKWMLVHLNQPMFVSTVCIFTVISMQ